MVPVEAGFCLIHQTGVDLTGETTRLAEALCLRLREKGLRPGMTLACQFPHRALYARLLFLLPRMGCVFLPLDPDLPGDVRQQLLKAAGRHVFLDKASDLETPEPENCCSEEWQPLDPEQPCLLLATSGTTGRPRLVELTGAALQASARAACGFLELEKGDGWLACLPLHHIGGLSVLLRCAFTGVKAVLMEDFSPADVMLQLRERRLTHVSLVPAMLYRLLREEAQPPSSLRVVLLGGAPAARSLVDEALDRGWPVCPSYGLTEAASQVATVYPPDLNWQEGEAGLILPHLQVKVETTTGAIRIRGASVAHYCRNARGRREPLLDAGGWLDTGDAGWLDGEGRLHLSGRRDDMLISGGENIHPAAVETLFSGCPGVEQLAVTGMDDPRWGDALVLLYQGDASPQQVKNWAATRLRSGFLPRHFVQVDGLPRNSLGKLLRAELKKLAQAGVRSGKA
jgi:O-succinylbenzoic acid--CoA ligase